MLRLTVLGIGIKTLIPEKKKKQKLRLSDYTPRAIAEREAWKRQAAQQTDTRRAKRKKTEGGHKVGAEEKKKKTFSDKLALVRGVTRMADRAILRISAYGYSAAVHLGRHRRCGKDRTLLCGCNECLRCAARAA